MLKRYGATKFALFDEGDMVAIGFEMKERRCKMVLSLPNLNEFQRTPDRRIVRKPDAMKSAHAQAVKAKYRSLFLVIKAKLEAIESGIETFEQAFMAHIMLPNGKTVGEQIIPQVKDAYVGGGMPMLMLTSGGAK